MSEPPPDPAEPARATEPGESSDGLGLARRISRSYAASIGDPTSDRTDRPARTARTDRSGGRIQRRRTRPGQQDARLSGAHPDDRDPQGLSEAVGRLVSDHGWSLDLKVHGVFGRWPLLVGAEIAEHARPESFADGRLVVRADSTAWATQLRLLGPDLVRRLNTELGQGTITVVEVLGPHSTRRAGGWRVPGRGERDTYG